MALIIYIARVISRLNAAFTVAGNLSAVEHRHGRAPGRRQIIRRADRLQPRDTVLVPGEARENRLGETMPGGLAGIGQVERTEGVSLSQLREDRHSRVREIGSRRGGAVLIGTLTTLRSLASRTMVLRKLAPWDIQHYGGRFRAFWQSDS
jgi:hypothetical protein